MCFLKGTEIMGLFVTTAQPKRSFLYTVVKPEVPLHAADLKFRIKQLYKMEITRLVAQLGLKSCFQISSQDIVLLIF